MKTKKIFLAFTALVISASAFSQVDTSRRDTSARRDTIHKRDTTGLTTQSSASGQTTMATSDVNVPKPNHGRYYIPVLGTYQAQDAGTTTASVSITPDETNPGKVWIEGLGESRFYALLKSAPGTYKIPAQKQSEKPVAEGEIRYDESNKSITICVGCGFHDGNTATPTTEPVTTSTAKNSGTAKTAKKAKSTIINFTGVKTDNGSVSMR